MSFLVVCECYTDDTYNTYVLLYPLSICILCMLYMYGNWYIYIYMHVIVNYIIMSFVVSM